MSHLKLEFVIVEVTRGDRPPRYLGRAITERGKELSETVPVDCSVLVWEIIIDSDPIMFSFGEPQEWSWGSTYRQLSPEGGHTIDNNRVSR
jgi:hypothetical protein